METINQKQAAALLGITDRRLRQIGKEDNPPVRDAEGQYPCAEFGAWMRADWRRGVGFTDDGTAYDFDAERARLTHHEANIKAMDEERKRGDLIPADEVKQAWGDMVAAARSKLLAIPSRLAPVCAMKPPAEIEAEARKLVHEALNELSKSMHAYSIFERLLQLIPGAAAECSKKAAEEIELVFRKLVAEVFGEELPEEGGAAEKHQ
jgi:hypothetical protein